MKAYLVMESPFSLEAVDGIKDKESIEGAPWSRIVFKPKKDVDPFTTASSASVLAKRCQELGIMVQVVEVDIGFVPETYEASQYK